MGVTVAGLAVATAGSAGAWVSSSMDTKTPGDSLPAASLTVTVYPLTPSARAAPYDQTDAESRAESTFYRISTDAGLTWGAQIQLEPPPAFGPDTTARMSLNGLFPFYDAQDRVHLVVVAVPTVRDTPWIAPAEVWHWCPDNVPPWSEIHRAEARQLMASVGYNACYADRPSIGEDGLGRLYVAWEQFDSSNVEPATSLLRAGIWIAGSTDNGLTWNQALRLTPENTVSHRFPCVVDRPGLDSVGVTYLMDLQAGFIVQGQGSATANPVVFHWVPAALLGVELFATTEPVQGRPGTTVVRGVLNMERQSGVGGSWAGAGLYDVRGRKVMELAPGVNDVSRLAPGVYFAGPASGAGRRAGMNVRLVVVK
uniref:Exo-alpha-sialidase n=1 Tax=candidate division WOR-3 bacterium TaxID=2052148 RepID=A0A7C4GGP0_UNCW3